MSQRSLNNFNFGNSFTKYYSSVLKITIFCAYESGLNRACLELRLNFSSSGQYVFWHSSAHILGEAMEKLYGGHLCYGPPIEEGFYYDMWCERYFISLQKIFTTVLEILFNILCHYFCCKIFPFIKKIEFPLKCKQ